MGAYISALLAQITAPSNADPRQSPLLEDDEQNGIGITENEPSLNYDSPSPSDRSVSIMSNHKTSDTEDEVVDRDKGAIGSMMSPIEENDFVNHGVLHYNKVRAQWRRKPNDGLKSSNDSESWEPALIDDDEMDELYRCIAEEVPFEQAVPLETITEIMNKIWKHEQMMGYEISKHHGAHALALDRL